MKILDSDSIVISNKPKLIGTFEQEYSFIEELSFLNDTVASPPSVQRDEILFRPFFATIFHFALQIIEFISEQINKEQNFWTFFLVDFDLIYTKTCAIVHLSIGYLPIGALPANWGIRH